MGMQGALGTQGCGGKQEGQGEEGRESWVSIGSHCSLIPQKLWSMSYGTELVLPAETERMASCDLMSSY